MRASQILGLVAMPLAAAMPAATNHYAHEAGGHLDTRVTLTDATQFQFEPFNLTNVGMECTRNTTEQMYSCELRFDWHDPNSVRENKVTTCSCISTWSWDGLTAASGEKNTYGTSYSMCYKQLPTYFEMRFATFNSSEDFSLEVAHHYKDSENFTAPYNYPTTFAHPDIHLPVIKRQDTLIQLYDAGPIYAKIQGVTA